MKLQYIFIILLFIACKNDQKKSVDTSIITAEQAIKTNVFKPLYEHGLTHKVGKVIRIIIPLDMHGYGSASPDCYSNDLYFELDNDKSFSLPASLNYEIKTHGCDFPKPVFEEGTFKLLESGDKFVNYYSPKHKSNLIILADKDMLYYFPDTKPTSIKVDEIDDIINNYDDSDPKALIPYMSSKMRG